MNLRSVFTSDGLFRVRTADEVFRRRRALDKYLVRYLRSCAVCTTALPPIDFLCPPCWRRLGQLMNRGESLRQADYVLPTYSLLTWTPQTAPFVKPLIYAFKGGRAPIASEKLATLFLNEYPAAQRRSASAADLVGGHAAQPAHDESVLLSAPAQEFDHSALWSHVLARATNWPSYAVLEDKTSRAERQKELQAGERGLRRFALREDFATQSLALEAAASAKRIVFADDVVTSGSTAMAAYMALGDPNRFEVWTLVARPRLAAKQGSC